MQATVATAGCPCKVRLQLAADGTALIDTEPLAPLLAPPQVALATTAIDSQEPLLYHKTTWRPWYEGALQDHPGCLDVLFCNRRGEVTEGTFHNLVVEQHGRLVTPSVACGLLPGTIPGYSFSDTQSGGSSGYYGRKMLAQPTTPAVAAAAA